MQTLFAVVYFCTAITCSVGWINEPFQDEITCRAYSQIYAEEMRKREPKSKGEIYCVEESLLKKIGGRGYVCSIFDYGDSTIIISKDNKNN